MSPGPVHGATKVLGVIGRPIAHSLSPLIHNLWLDQHRIPALYVAFPGSDAPAGAALFTGLFHAGIHGLNVTAPFKDAAFAASQAAGDRERDLRAVNVLVRGESGWVGHNTDSDGFLLALWEARLKHGLPQSLSGQRIVLLGAGGAARACALALRGEGADLVAVNRDSARSRDMRDRFGAETYGFADLASAVRGAGLVINSLPAAADTVFGDFPWGLTAESAMAADLGYARPESPFLAGARKAHRSEFDGLGMLIHQAALSFKLWWGIAPDIETARKAALDALERRP